MFNVEALRSIILYIYIADSRAVQYTVQYSTVQYVVHNIMYSGIFMVNRMNRPYNTPTHTHKIGIL